MNVLELIDTAGTLVAGDTRACWPRPVQSNCAPWQIQRVDGTGDDMNATQQLYDLGQSLWLDNMTRALLTSGTLSR